MITLPTVDLGSIYQTHENTHTLTLRFPSLSSLKAAFWIHLSAPWLNPGARDQVFHPPKRNSPVKVPLYQLILSPRAPTHLRHCHSFIFYYSSMTSGTPVRTLTSWGRRALWSLYGARGGSGAVDDLCLSINLSLPKRYRSFSQPLSTEGNDCLVGELTSISLSLSHQCSADWDDLSCSLALYFSLKSPSRGSHHRVRA